MKVISLHNMRYMKSSSVILASVEVMSFCNLVYLFNYNNLFIFNQ